MKCRMFFVCLVLGAILPQFSGDLLHAAPATPAAREHRIVAGDSIRAILLRYNCITSMREYVHARRAFAQLNPAVAHSGALVPNARVRVPVYRKQESSCLRFREGRIVRIEFEVHEAKEKVSIYLDSPVLPDLFMLDGVPPGRVVCDFDGTLPENGLRRDVECHGRLVRRIRVGHDDKPYKRARVVLDVEHTLFGHVDQKFFEQDSVVVLTIHEASENGKSERSFP